MENKSNFNELAKAALLKGVQTVLETGKEWKDPTLHLPVELAIEAISDSGFENLDNFETNGWDYDWWQSFEYVGKRYTLHGSGYYGGLSFFPNEH
jgi:hypothetical protein